MGGWHRAYYYGTKRLLICVLVSKFLAAYRYSLVINVDDLISNMTDVLYLRKSGAIDEIRDKYNVRLGLFSKFSDGRLHTSENRHTITT